MAATHSESSRENMMCPDEKPDEYSDRPTSPNTVCSPLSRAYTASCGFRDAGTIWNSTGNASVGRCLILEQPSC